MKTRPLYRILFNFWPSYRGGGGRIKCISRDFKKIKVKIPYSLKTRNYVGTTFGGTMYAAIDPILMVMLIKILGKEYVVWDKSASIKYLKPAKKHLYADFEISDELIAQIKNQLETENKLEIDFPIKLADKDNLVYAEITKRLYFKKKY
jgi:hypothetical protein